MWPRTGNISNRICTVSSPDEETTRLNQAQKKMMQSKRPGKQEMDESAAST